MLFIPGHKNDWTHKALTSGTDALIFDLEDSVPSSEKAGARSLVAASLDQVRSTHPRTGLWVRPNAWDSELTGLDLQDVVRESLNGLILPKIETASDVLRFDTLVTHFELRNGVPKGRIEFIVSLETALGMANCDAIARAPRVASLIGATAKNADTQRALGYQFTADGQETLYLRSKILLACRAAGIRHPLCALWQDIKDIDGLTKFAQQNAQLGYRGQLLIHPSHVAPVHQIYSPSEDQIDFYRGMIAAFERGQREGHGAVEYEGEHIDLAHVTTARDFLDQIDRNGINRHGWPLL